MNYYLNKELYIEGEIWKDIPFLGFHGYYQVSSYGRVKSLSREWNNRRRGDIILSQGRKFRNGMITHTNVILSGVTQTKSFQVSALVTACFFPEFYGKREYIIIHKDGHNENNTVDNIVHVLESDFRSHSNPARKLSLSQIIEIRKLATDEIKPKGFYLQYAKNIGITYQHLRCIMRNKAFKDLEMYDTDEFLTESSAKRAAYNSAENVKARQKESARARWKSGKIQKTMKKRFQRITAICACCGKVCHPKSATQEYNLRHKGFIYCSRLCANTKSGAL